MEVRLTETETETEAETKVSGALLELRASPLCCTPLSKLLVHVLMSEWNDVTSRRQRRYETKSQGWRAQSGLRAPEWRCAACKTRSFPSRDTCRGCGKLRDVKHDEYIKWSQTVAWPQQGGGSSRDVAYPRNKPKGAAFALARQQLAQAKASALLEACIRILENEVQEEEAAMKQAQPMGQRRDQARARFRRAVESGEKAMQVLQKAQENFEQAQEVTSPDRPAQAHAGKPRCQ